MPAPATTTVRVDALSVLISEDLRADHADGIAHYETPCATCGSPRPRA